MRTYRDRKSRRPGGVCSNTWEKMRRVILERDGYQCVLCKRFGRMEVDHKIPFHKGGTNDPSNLQTLCRGCHIDKTQKEMYALRGKRTDRYAPGFRDLLKELRN